MRHSMLFQMKQELSDYRTKCKAEGTCPPELQAGQSEGPIACVDGECKRLSEIMSFPTLPVSQISMALRSMVLKEYYYNIHPNIGII